MGIASDQVKSIAREVAPSVGQDRLAYIIEKYGLNE